ncbi:MAG: signal peptide peptidase SppA [Sphingobacteriaceae bacterium]|nr:signal peptide peptidase SppA [Sphingobacteriaceae bacterium]
MKQFFGAFFGSLIGLFLATILGIVVIIAVIKSSIGEAMNEDDSGKAKSAAVIKIKLSGNINEREIEDPFEEFRKMNKFANEEGTGLNSLARKLEGAKNDEKVKGIYLEVQALNAGFASIKEVRDLLLDFKKSGKFIYTYGEYYGQKEYYLASVSDKIYLNPQGAMDLKGLSMSIMFFKKTFEKLGVDVQIFRHGKFKSAIEPFMLDKMSEANRLQSETFLNSIWNTMLVAISESRNLSKDSLQIMANTLRISSPGDALENKLVDGLVYMDEFMSELKKKAGQADKEKLNMVGLGKYAFKEKAKTAKDKIAVIYANGGISSGEGDDQEIGSDRIAKAIKEARLNDQVKAIVLRVNSPGGSALASDVIWRETVLAGKSKPLVVSMGNYAASGGYYISCAAERIFAQPNTITGSIGVFGMIPNMQKLLDDKLGITIDTVNTNKYSHMGTGLMALDEQERKYIQASVEKVYDTFTSRVAEGRKMKQSDVDSIGQGRVWSGADAIAIGLVDELGGLNNAIQYASKKAGITDYKILELPKPKNPFEDLFGKSEKDAEMSILQKNLGPVYPYLKSIRQILSQKGVQARMPFELEIN